MVNLPNLITIARMLMVPLTVWLMLSGEFLLSFLTFVIAGVSDAIDGFLARRFNWHTELGTYLDPLADKALLVSIFVVLGGLKEIPIWLVIMVVTRDVLIVGAVMLAWVLGKPVAMQPLWISKVNTTAQIAFAGLVLFFLGWGLPTGNLILPGAICVGVLTVASGSLYLRDWLRHMNSTAKGSDA